MRPRLTSIPGAKLPPHDPETGEIESAGVEPTPDAADAAPETPHASGAALSVEDIAREAAMRGEAIFRTYYKKLTGPAKQRVDAMGNELRGIMDAVYDPSADDNNDAHLKLVEAFKHGQQAKADGHLRRAIPTEYREPNATRAALCWQAGFDGQAMPEFGE